MNDITGLFPATTLNRRVREFVCAYRPLRDEAGNVVVVPALCLTTPQLAARILVPLVASEAVEVLAVAYLSARSHLLAWQLLSRGMRNSAQVSVPEVFVPAIMTPGTTGIIVLHNHPSGDPSPSLDDLALTRKLQAAATTLGFDLLDHLIAGDPPRYYSFRESGVLGSRPETVSASEPGR